MAVSIARLRKKYPDATTFKFGDNKALSDQLISLVVKKKKTATCGALTDYTDGGDSMPVVGRRDIVLDWNDTPVLVVETVSVEQKRFCDVEEEFALKEGENNSLEGWRSDHQTYFERTGDFSHDMILVCEEFKLVENLQKN